ncbi:MAG: phosphatidylserine/phosphatidylglycerophosphate/cardiolipin synthase family protein [Oligoflexia bacterium]|nr:phosphatidylserine/phosphatidylglycerophosphate/cardiolipin synthase family protein [Oligoflexia bacterium]
MKSLRSLSVLLLLTLLLASCQSGAVRNLASEDSFGRPLSRTLPSEARTHLTRQEILIESFDEIALSDGAPGRTITLPTWYSDEHEIRLENRAFSNSLALAPSETGGDRFFIASLSCDNGVFSVKRTGPAGDFPRVSRAKFELRDSRWNAERITLVFGPSATNCALLLVDPANPRQRYGIRFVREDLWHPKLASWLWASQDCELPLSASSGPDALFLSSRFANMTCPGEAEELTPLPDAFDAFNEKVALLLGQKLPREALESQNPFIELDFSKAPRLDVILVSYLSFRADFSGTLLSRLLKWHADRGAVVKIFVSDVMTLKKDRALFQRLTQSSPTITVRQFRYQAPAWTPLGRKADELHRTMHVKLLLTFSESDPARNAAIIGGRNIHDGFLFTETKDRSAWKDVVDYTRGDEVFIHWKDFEVKIRSRAFVKTLAQHFFTLWAQDADTHEFRSFNTFHRKTERADPRYLSSADRRLVRHLVSVPYVDHRQLEDFFVEAFDSARRKIRLSTPYFNLTPRLRAAVERAVARGIDLALITRVRLDGDTADLLLSDVNKENINRLLDRMTIYEHAEPRTILHSKFIVIDDQLTLMGSVNLNRRSFLHDMENELLISSPEFANEMDKLWETYKKSARLIDQPLKTIWWKSLFVEVFRDEF